MPKCERDNGKSNGVKGKNSNGNSNNSSSNNNNITIGNRLTPADVRTRKAVEGDPDTPTNPPRHPLPHPHPDNKAEVKHSVNPSAVIGNLRVDPVPRPADRADRADHEPEADIKGVTNILMNTPVTASEISR